MGRAWRLEVEGRTRCLCGAFDSAADAAQSRLPHFAVKQLSGEALQDLTANAIAAIAIEALRHRFAGEDGVVHTDGASTALGTLGATVGAAVSNGRAANDLPA